MAQQVKQGLCCSFKFHAIVVQSILLKIVAVDKYMLFLHIQVLAKERCCCVLLRIENECSYLFLCNSFTYLNSLDHTVDFV